MLRIDFFQSLLLSVCLRRIRPSPWTGRSNAIFAIFSIRPTWRRRGSRATSISCKRARLQRPEQLENLMNGGGFWKTKLGEVGDGQP